MTIDSDYEGLNRIVYDFGREGSAWFIPVCPECGKFVKVRKLEYIENGLGERKWISNAICKRHGVVLMPFDGWM